jgi:hypothetical protein
MDKAGKTPKRFLTLYPEGFSVISSERDALGELKADLQTGIARGDIPMFHCWMGKAFGETLRAWCAEVAKAAGRE